MVKGMAIKLCQPICLSVDLSPLWYRLQYLQNTGWIAMAYGSCHTLVNPQTVSNLNSENANAANSIEYITHTHFFTYFFLYCSYL